MQFWFARGSEVSIREQLVTQVVLGILSDDLAPGQRLPSTRDLARRFQVHPNTVSAGYRELERERWVEFRRGSGVYVRASKPEISPSPALAMDQMIAQLFRSARKLGVTLPVLRSRLQQWLELQPPDHFLLIEPDEELRRILAAEIARAVSFPVESCSVQDCPKMPEGGIPAWDDPAKAPDLMALAAGVVVRDEYPEQFAGVHHALFAARHDAGLDLRDRDAVAGVLDAAGVPADKVLAQVDSGEPIDEIERAHLQAVGEWSVFGVPTFVVDGRAVFVRLMSRPGDDGALARRTIEGIVQLMDDQPDLNEFKFTTLTR